MLLLTGSTRQLETEATLMGYVSQVFESLQCELCVILAVFLHLLFFGRNNLFLFLLRQRKQGLKSVRGRDSVDVVAVNQQLVAVPEAATQKQAPLTVEQQLDQKHHRRQNSLAKACTDLVGNRMLRNAYQRRRALAAEIRRHLDVREAEAVSAVTAETAADALVGIAWKQAFIGSHGLEILETFREVLRPQGLMRSERLMETMLRCYLQIDALSAFDGCVADLEANAADKLPLCIREVIFRGALRKGEFHECMRRFQSIREEWLTTHSARQCLIQSLGRAAGQQGHLPEMLSALCGMRLTCESVNVLLRTAAEFRDTVSFGTVVRLGREGDVHFNTVTYCLLLSEARSFADKEQLLDEALGKAAMRGVLSKVAELAADRGDKLLGEAVLRRLPTSRTEIEKRHMPAVAALLRNREMEQDVIRLYEQHFAELDFSTHAQAEVVVLDAALRYERADIVARVLEAPNLSRRAATVKRLGANGRLADVVRVLGASTSAWVSRHVLLEGAISGRDIKLAQEIFQEAEMSGQLDSVLYSVMIRAHLDNGDARKAISFVRNMRQSGLKLTGNQDDLIKSALTNVPHQLVSVLEQLKACGLKLSTSNGAEILKSVGHSRQDGEIETIMVLLDELVDEMDEVCFCAAIDACVRLGRADLLEMQLKRRWARQTFTVRNTHTYASVIRAYGCLEDSDNVWATWRSMRLRYLTPTSVAIGCMVEALAICGLPEAGYELIHELLLDEKLRPLVNAVTYCSVLKGFSHKRLFGRVWDIYQEMLKEGMNFTSVTFNTLLNACARCGEMSRAPEVLDEMARWKIMPNLITYSAILKGYCQADKLDKAYELLESMRRTTSLVPDEVMYNSLLDGCARKGLYDRGVQVLTDMERDGVKPSNFTLSLLMKLAGRGNQLDKAFEIMEDVPRRFKFTPNVHVYSNLVAACLQHQALPRAMSVLEIMAQRRVRPDARIYGIMIRACVAAGQLQDAEGLLRTAFGLSGGHRVMGWNVASANGRGAAVLGDSTNFALQDASELAVPMLTELLTALANSDECAAMDLARDLQDVPRVQIDPKMKLRLLTKRVQDSPTSDSGGFTVNSASAGRILAHNGQ